MSLAAGRLRARAARPDRRRLAGRGLHDRRATSSPTSCSTRSCSAAPARTSRPGPWRFHARGRARAAAPPAGPPGGPPDRRAHRRGRALRGRPCRRRPAEPGAARDGRRDRLVEPRPTTGGSAPASRRSPPGRGDLGDPAAVRLHRLGHPGRWPAPRSPRSTAGSPGRRSSPRSLGARAPPLRHEHRQRDLRRPPGHRHDHLPARQPRDRQGPDERARRVRASPSVRSPWRSLVGLYLVALRGPAIVVLGLLGLVGGYVYTAPPFQYKYHALGVPLVFLLMGPLMVVGSYFAVTGAWSLTALVLSIPVGLLVAAILHGNEWRDISEDTRAGHRRRCRRGSAASGRTTGTSPSSSAPTSRSAWRSPSGCCRRRRCSRSCRCRSSPRSSARPSWARPARPGRSR